MIHSYAGHMRMLQMSLVLFHNKWFVLSPAEKKFKNKSNILINSLPKSVILGHKDSQRLSQIALSTF